MNQSIGKKRRKEASKKTESGKVGLQVERRESKAVFVMPEYYVLPFQYLHGKYFSDLPAIIREARYRIKKEYADRVGTGHTRTLNGDDAFNFLLEFTRSIEQEMAILLASHSPYFWLHLYRRIGVGNIAEEGEKSDASTLMSVRKTVETAILKYGNLSITDDMCSSDSMSPRQVLDGLFYEVMTAAKKSEAEIDYFWKGYKNQWVMRNYRRADHETMYMLEGYAYEYWRATANMRAVGKGASLVVYADGTWSEERSAELGRLISSYDRRLSAGQNYLSTAKGLLSFSRKSLDSDGLTRSNFLFAIYNVDRVPMKSLSTEFKDFEGVSTNFLPVALDYVRFLDAHKIFRKPFKKRFGFSLDSVLIFLWAISIYVMYFRKAERGPDAISVFHLLQRAYAQINLSLNDLAAEITRTVKMFKVPETLDAECFDIEILEICKHFSLSRKSQSLMSLWSFGPRPVIIPFGQSQLLDIGGVQGLLTNLFFGVRENQQQRGIEFENILRDEIEHRGYDLLKDRILRLSDTECRETDLVIRVNDALFLCDCRSIERPLDFFIGKPSTIIYRNDLMEKKVQQVKSLKEFVRKNPVGRNYNYSWAKSIFSIGVLPDIEWIWSEGDEYWVDREINLPVLMNVQELFGLLERASKGLLR